MPACRPTRTAPLLLIGSCASLQFGAALAARLFPELGSWGTTVLRLGFAAAVLLAISRPPVRRWHRGQWLAVVALGLSLAGMNGFFYATIARIPLGPAVAIEFIGPLTMAVLLSRRARDLAWVGLAVTGMLLFGLESLSGAGALDPLGVVFALVAALFWSLYVQTGSRVGILVPGTGGLAVALAIATVTVAPLGLSGAARALPHTHLLLLALGTALLASVIPYTLELAALRRISRRLFSILLSLEPVVATLAGWLLLGQGNDPLRLCAIALVVAASLGSSLTATDHPPVEPARTDETHPEPSRPELRAPVG